MSPHAAKSASVLRSAVRLNVVLLVMLAAVPFLALGSFLRGFGLAVGYAVAALLLLSQHWTVWYGRSGVALLFGCAVLALAYGRALMVEPAILAPTA